MLAKYIVLSLFAIFVVGSTLWYVTSPSKEEIEVSFSPTETQVPIAQSEEIIILTQLEREIGVALQYGGIEPNRYDEIDALLRKLEGEGVEPERTNVLRERLLSLDIGGSRQKEVNVNPVQPILVPIPKPTPVPVSIPVVSLPTPAQPTCVSNVAPVFTNYLIDPTSVNNILPPPNRPKSDVSVLKTHSYINTPAIEAPIYAPVDMELISGAHYVGGPYMVDFRVSCEVKVRLAHITKVVQKIVDVLPKDAVVSSHDVYVNPPISFKAGELIGYSGGPPYTLAIGFDFGVYNSATPNRFASQPEKYQSTIYTTAVCPFDYFTPVIRDEYRKKYYLLEHGGMQFDLPHFCG